jgi:acetoin utilization protein AcuB
MSNKTVGNYMSASPHSIGADQTLALAHSMMKKHGIRHLPVLSAGKITGILSDRDLRFIESFRDVDPNKVKVDQAMSLEVYTVEPSARLATVAAQMAEQKVGSAVVMRGGEVVGVLTTTDLLRALADVLRD